jgi:hypothetical protein
MLGSEPIPLLIALGKWLKDRRSRTGDDHPIT